MAKKAATQPPSAQSAAEDPPSSRPSLAPAIEINVVDWFARKGYRFKGIATVVESGPLFDELISFYNQSGLSDAPRRIQAVVMVKVQRALPLVSPAYDRDVTEDQVRARWENHYQQIRPKQ